jgi:hypothetical protein
VQHQFCAFCIKNLGTRLPNAARCACDENDFIFKCCIHKKLCLAIFDQSAYHILLFLEQTLKNDALMIKLRGALARSFYECLSDEISYAKFKKDVSYF